MFVPVLEREWAPSLGLVWAPVFVPVLSCVCASVAAEVMSLVVLEGVVEVEASKCSPAMDSRSYFR